MQDRIARIDETPCTARPDHTFGSFSTEAAEAACPVISGSPPKAGVIQQARFECQCGFGQDLLIADEE